MKACRRIFLVLAVPSLHLSIAPAQTLTENSPPVLGGSTDAAHMGLGLRNAGNVDPVTLDQYFDAAPTRRNLNISAPTDTAFPARHRRKQRIIFKPATHRSLIVRVPPAPPPNEHIFRQLQSQPSTTDRYDELIMKYSKMYGLDPRLVKSVMAAESEFNPRALSKVKARGLMQLMPQTAEEMGVSRQRLTDPESNIRAGAAYIHRLFQSAWLTFHLPGSDFQQAPLWLVQRVIAGYHAGPKFMHGSWWYRATRDYIRRVLLFYRSKVTDLRRMPEYRTPGPQFATIFSPEFIRY